MFGAKSQQLSKQSMQPLDCDLETTSAVSDASKEKYMTIGKTSLKYAASTAIFSVLAGFTAQIAYASHLDFTLYNESSKSIHYLYVSPARSDRWGPDILGSDTLDSGEYTKITFPHSTSNSPCIYDVRVVFADRTKRESRHNLCEVESLTVR